MIKKLWKDKRFFKAMLAIALPIALQNLIISSLNMLDTLMISSLGDASIAAVGLANQVFFLYILLAFGINSGSSIFIAQFWGKRDIESIRKILGLAISLTIIVALLFTIVAFFAPEFLMGLLTSDEEVIDLGSQYLRIVSLSYIVTGISFSYSTALRSIGQAKLPTAISAISFVTNGLFNWLLIFGKLGFPRLEVRGAAYGTLIARIAEIVFILYIIYRSRGVLAANLKELTNWSKNFIKKYLVTTFPVIINEGVWSLGQVMYSVAYAKIGKEAVAAVQIATTVQNIFMVISRGLANACTVMVGNKIGEENENEAKDYAGNFLILSTSIGILLGATLFILSDLFLMMFSNLTSEVYEMSKQLLRVIGVFFFIKMFNGTTIVGVLRGGGDTRFSMLIEMASVWLIGVPLAFIGAVTFKLPVYLVFILVSTEEIIKAIVGFWRVRF